MNKVKVIKFAWNVAKIITASILIKEMVSDTKTNK